MTRRRATVLGIVALALLARPHSVSALWIPDGTPLVRSAGDQVQPATVSDGGGGAIVVWSDSRRGETNFDIYAQRVSVRGTPRWGANGVAVCSAAGDQFRPVAVSDGPGGAIIAWVDTRKGDLDIYAQRISSSGTPLWAADGVAVCDAPGDQYSIAIAFDGSGGCIVVWEDFRDGAAQRDVFAQRVDASGTVLWTSQGVPFQSSNRGGLPAMAADGIGGAIVAWEDSLDASERDIRAQRVDAIGTKLWAPGGIAISVAAGAQTAPRIVVSRDGAIIVWTDNRSGTPTIYGQRAGSDGAARWAADGVPISSGTGDAVSPVCVGSPDGGIIIGWVDYRNAGSAKLFTQRIDTLGVGLWTPGGIGVSASPGDQLTPAIDTDGAGGAIMAWFNFTVGVGSDIYAQRVDSLGAVQWGGGGAPVSIQPGLQSLPSITANGSGSAIIAWQDFRTGIDQDIYAARLLPNGAAIEIPAATYVRQGAPNPFRSETLLEFGLPSPGRVRIRIFDTAGRLVSSLLDENRPAGVQGAIWNGHDGRGMPVGSGIYLAEVRTPGVSRVLKISLIR
jgi:hypothetical protein